MTLTPLFLALLLGLRHAADPDHLTAVSTLVLTERGRLARHAGQLGLAWGLGHATTLLLLGIPAVLLGRLLPDGIQRAAEVVVGVLIVGLAVRLLYRWRQGYFHSHAHRHGDVEHVHPHVHAASDAHEHAPHAHPHAARLGRTPLAAWGIGLVHGIGGSAGAGVLLIASIPERRVAVMALAVFAGATALSMALLSATFGFALGRPAIRRGLPVAIPVLGVLTLAFGAWYALAASGLLS